MNLFLNFILFGAPSNYLRFFCANQNGGQDMRILVEYARQHRKYSQNLPLNGLKNKIVKCFLSNEN